MKKIIALSAILLLAQSCALNPFGGAPVSGGVLGSTDSGESWGFADSLEGTEGGSLRGTSIGRIVQDQNNTEILFLASPTGGVYKSVNSGNSWKQVLSGRIYDVAVSRTNNQVIFAGGSVGSVAKVFKSEDGGDTWLEVYSESEASTYISALTFMDSGSDRILIGSSSGEIYVSYNSGLSWNLHSMIQDRVINLVVAHNNTSIIYALAMRGGLNRSTDQGKSWSPIKLQEEPGKYYDIELLGSNDNAFYLATEKGLYRSATGGSNFDKLSIPSRDKSNVVTAVAVNPRNANDVYATIGGVFYKSLDSGRSWQTHSLPATQNVRDIAVDPDQPNIIYIAQGQVLQ